MRVLVYLAVSLAAAVAVGPAFAQVTKPFEELEASRRDRIASDKRMAREAAEQRRKDKEKVAAGVRDAAAQKAASQPPLPSERRATKVRP
jgi:hypothetical protein